MDFSKITSWSIPGMTNVYKVLDERGKIIWQRDSGGGDSDAFTPFTLSTSDGVCALLYNTSTNMVPSTTLSRGAYTFAAGSMASKTNYLYIGIPLSGYAYTPMPSRTNGSENNKYIITNYTLLCIPKGCKTVTMTWTKSNSSSGAVILLVRNVSDNSTLATAQTTESTRTVTMDVATACATGDRWLEACFTVGSVYGLSSYGTISISFT